MNIAKYTQRNNNLKQGFTLVELLVSMSLYTITASVLISTVLALSNVSVRLRNNVFALNDMNLFLESLQRDIKMASNFRCDDGLTSLSDHLEIFGSFSRLLPNDCAFDSSLITPAKGGNFRLGFKMQDGNYVSYMRDNNENIKLDKYDSAGNLISSEYVFAGSTNSTNIKITTLWFYVSGTDQTDGRQPTITIKINGRSGASDQRGQTSERAIEQQFTVTPRSIDG